ncbi:MULTISPECIES: hypothetical protein [Pseudomonas]|uniref:Uncharacterized protein n=1 Tax=Pseudomonas monachiensis TaxID=3060212 RepID=A0ABW9HH45_9PSED|nr:MULTISPECIES: hypothetical protein [unclassified Pseudomonas]KRA86337.1 hypothetical protein ASD91_18190 [Pseudomonas sp. Root68]KRB64328.1 hypothetical protein ASD95_15460 [Pseudomonas sp. Root71]
MNKNEERSFTARVSCNGDTITFLQEVLRSNFLEDAAVPKNILTVQRDYSPKITKAYNPITKRMENLGFSFGNIDPLVVHFWCYDDYYNMQILSTPYSYMYVSKNDEGCLGAFPAAGGDTTSFNLLDADHNIITLDDLSTDTPTVYLKARNARIIRKSIHEHPERHSFFHDRVGDIVKFNLTILKRHAF